MKTVINRATSVKKPNKRNKKWSTKILYVIAVLSGLGLLFTILGSLTVIFIFTAFSSTLPSPSRLSSRSIEQSTKIFDRNGELLYSVYEDKDRTLVTLNEISPDLINATLSIEDDEFYKHEGIDPFGIARSVFITVTTSGKQGGSTLTQQVAKNALLTPERTISRKIKDVVLALQIEKSYTKDEILQMYLNEVPYGGTTWGVEAASKTYFGKSARDLTLAESALIAGLPQRPTYYSPFRDPEVAKNRQLRVLKGMRERGWIDRDGNRQYLSEEDYEWAKNERLDYNNIAGTFRAPHFVMYVLGILEERYGVDAVQSGGLNVTTSIDLNLQETYQQIAAEEVEKAASLNLTNAGLVAIDPKTRQILAMVGSIDYFSNEIDGQFNVTLGLRQPGSTLKPITYLTGLTQGYTASTVLYDVYTEFVNPDNPNAKPYGPNNYGGWGFRGPTQIRYALANSVNTTAVKMLDLVGIQNMVTMANNLGIQSLYYDPAIHGLALTLGGGEVTLLELTNGFSSLAAGGVYRDVAPILSVTDYKGTILETYVETSGIQVVDSGNVWIITDILSDNSARSAAFGTNSQIHIPNQKVAVKTGTSNDLKDNWTIGFTDDIAIGVWVGNNDNSEMNARLASGLTGAAPIWNRAMNHYLEDHPHPEFPKPSNIESAWVGRTSGMVPYEEEEDRRMEYFIKGTEPKAKSDIFQRVKVCKDGEVKDKTYVVYQAQKPEWQPYLKSWIEGRYKDDEGELYKYMGPEFQREREPERFDIENCEKDDDD